MVGRVYIVTEVKSRVMSGMRGDDLRCKRRLIPRDPRRVIDSERLSGMFPYSCCNIVNRALK